MSRMDGKVVVITGGAGGIGQAAAVAFARENAVVGVLDRDEQAVAAVVKTLPGHAVPLVCDVSDEESVAGAIGKMVADAGGIDVLYTCAAVQSQEHDAPVGRLSRATWEQILAVNLTGVFLCCKHTVPVMTGRGGGSIILCGSSTALTSSGANASAYAASKGGVLALTRAMAADYASAGIRVNAIIPGTTQTPLIEHILSSPEHRRKLESANLWGRLATPEDLTGIAVYLASDESTFATGAIFSVDGGRTMR